MADDERTVEQYRIDQLEAELAALRSSTKTLNFDQIKQMGKYIGIPVGVATTVFGAALWITILNQTDATARSQADLTLDRLTGEYQRLEGNMKILEDDTRRSSRELRDLRVEAGVLTKFVRDLQAETNARAQTVDETAQQMLARLNTAVETGLDATQVDQIAAILADENSDFRKIVATEVLGDLKGLVAAFDTGGCPSGWSDIGKQEPDRFAGRMMVVAGPTVDRSNNQQTQARSPNDEGGAEEVVLSEAQMPRHDHGLATALSGRDLQWFHANRSYPVPTDQLFEASAYDRNQGTAAPHPNMPPFIALYFCKKG